MLDKYYSKEQSRKLKHGRRETAISICKDLNVRGYRTNKVRINKKLKKSCVKKSIAKDELELIVVMDAKETLFQNEIIEFIAENIVKLQEKGIPLPVVQEILGHSKISTTMRYTHAIPQQKLEAINVLNNYFIN